MRAEGQGDVFPSRSGDLVVHLVALGAPDVLRAAEPDVNLLAILPIAASRSSAQAESFAYPGVGRFPRKARRARCILDFQAGHPLIRMIGIHTQPQVPPQPFLENADPVTYLLVGSRAAPAGRPPGMSAFNVFFDAPAKRPFQTYRSSLDLKHLRVTSKGHRATVAIGDLTIGPFTGELQLTVYDGSRLIHMETVIRTREDRRAILYDTGLALADPRDMRFSWVDADGRREQVDVDPAAHDRRIPAGHRLLIAANRAYSVACFPPPHQFFSPRDLTDNLSTAWYGTGHRGLDDRFGFGIRQSETGGGSFVPWFNAPPGAEQRLGVFFLWASAPQAALRETLRFTNGDRFPDLPGYRKFTTHWHMATAMAAMKEKEKGGPRSTPDFVKMFKDMGVNIVHLAEFHGDGHPQDPGPVRLAEMQAMFDECRRLSDRELLFLPGEEANSPLSLSDAGKRPGHWVYLFPGRSTGR